MALKKGFTTGSAAAAASAAACRMLLTGKPVETVSVMTPAGILYEPVIEEPVITDEYASCAVRKDGGDDVDATHGKLICSEVRFGGTQDEKVTITGGTGVGRVTRPGLDQPVGEYAINSTPRRMIREAVEDVCEMLCYEGPLTVTISVPEGEEVATHTFNSHLGIEGGISILGTSGIVEPMSISALLASIQLDVSMQKSEGMPLALMVPGNYGVTFLENNYGIRSERLIQCSNYVGDAIDMCLAEGFDRIVMVAHTGKFIKVSGGIMNTHSRDADSRMELLLAAAVEAAYTLDMGHVFTLEEQKKLLDAATTTAGLEQLRDLGLLEETSKVIINKIQKALDYRARGKAQIECVLYENSFGELAATEHAHELIQEVLEWCREH